MTLGFAECMPENDGSVYHVEWLENQQVFPPLSNGHDTATDSQDEWQFLHRHEILQAETDFPSDGGQLKTCEMEDTWQQVDVLQEKQFVQVAVEATDFPPPSKVAPVKPQRQHSPMTEEQQRHFYWEMIDQDEEGDFYDLYHDRKTHSNHKNNSKYGRRHHIQVWQRWHHRLELGDLWTNGKKMQQVMDYVHQHQQDSRNAIDKSGLNPRLIHGLTVPRHQVARSGPSSKVFKSLMEPDFCLQVKNG